MKVKECMCNKVFSCTPSTSVYDAAKIMQNEHVGCVPICDQEGCMVGMITDRDIVLRCVASEKNVKETPLSDVMTTNVCTCNPDDDMQDAQGKMASEQIRRLPVVEDGKVVGILTLGDIAKNDIELGQEEVSDTINNICDCIGENKNAE